MAYLVGILIGIAVGALAAWLILVSFTSNKLAAARRTRQLLITEARKEAEALRREADLEAKEAAVKHRAEVERELQGQRSDILRDRERLHAREDENERRLIELERREQVINDRETHVRQLQEEFKEAKERWNDHFERRYVALLFASAGSNVTRAAEHAGLSRRHFRELLYKHGIVERPADGGDAD